jgi:hypothetical protein
MARSWHRRSIVARVGHETGVSAYELGRKDQNASQTEGEQGFHRTCDRGIVAVGQSLQFASRGAEGRANSAAGERLGPEKLVTFRKLRAILGSAAALFHGASDHSCECTSDELRHMPGVPSMLSLFSRKSRLQFRYDCIGPPLQADITMTNFKSQAALATSGRTVPVG